MSQFGIHSFVLRHLSLELFHPLELRSIQTAIRGFPLVVGGRADTVLAAHLLDRHSGFRLFQNPHDRGRAEPRSLHAEPPVLCQKVLLFNGVFFGEAYGLTRLTVLCMVHPRVCGGNILDIGGRDHCMGTSPRVRGKRTSGCARDVVLGYIPACAGETVTGILRERLPKVHPACAGETTPLPVGSQELRVHPACAGETVTASAAVTMIRVHPRVCGGNIYRLPSWTGPAGTSPRVRGETS